MALGDLGKPVQRCLKPLGRRTTSAWESVLIGQSRPVVGMGDPGAGVAQRLKLPAPQMPRRSPAWFGWGPGDAPGFVELDDVVLADAATGQRRGEYVSESADALSGVGLGEVVVAVPLRLLRGIGDQLEDPICARCDLAARR